MNTNPNRAKTEDLGSRKGCLAETAVLLREKELRLMALSHTPLTTQRVHCRPRSALYTGLTWHRPLPPRVSVAHSSCRHRAVFTPASRNAPLQWTLDTDFTGVILFPMANTEKRVLLHPLHPHAPERGSYSALYRSCLHRTQVSDRVLQWFCTLNPASIPPLVPVPEIPHLLLEPTHVHPGPQGPTVLCACPASDSSFQWSAVLWLPWGS